MSRRARERDVVYDEREEYSRSGRDRERRETYEETDIHSKRGERDRRDPDFLRDDYGTNEAGPMVRITNGSRHRDENVKIIEEREVDIKRTRSPDRVRAPVRDREVEVRLERDVYEREPVTPRARTRDGGSIVERDIQVEREIIDSDSRIGRSSPLEAPDGDVLLSRDEYGSVYDRNGDIIINRYLRPRERERDSSTVIERDASSRRDRDRSPSLSPLPRRRADSYVERDRYERIERGRSPSPLPPIRDRGRDVYYEKDRYERIERKHSSSPVLVPLPIRERERDVVVEKDRYERIERRQSPSPARKPALRGDQDRDVVSERDRYERVERRLSNLPLPIPPPRERERDVVVERDRYERVERHRSPSPLPLARERERERDTVIERDRYERIERDRPLARPRSIERERETYRERDVYERVEKERSPSRHRARESELLKVQIIQQVATPSPPPARRDRERRGEVIREKDTFERDVSRGLGGEREVHEREVIEREIKETVPDPVPAPEPEIIRRPPIHQDIVHHHKHIDYGYERAPRLPSPSPSPPRPPPAPSISSRDEPFREVDTYSKHERTYDDDVVRERDVRTRREVDVRASREIRGRSLSGSRDSWGRGLDRAPLRKPLGDTAAEERWTELTKDLVVKEALEERGIEYQETDKFFYVMQYMRYVSDCAIYHALYRFLN